MEASSVSSKEQRKLEETVAGIYALAARDPEDVSRVQLKRDLHVTFLMRGLEFLGSSYSVLDASRPWICFWILHSLALLGEAVAPPLALRCITFLEKCQDPRGGFGGGPGQLPHLATTYAAVCALLTIGGDRAYRAINRPALLSFLLRMKSPDGSFNVHEDGEVDVRGAYTAMAVAHLLNFRATQLQEGVSEYVARCQTYEGGIGGEPGVEAHGGYTFCGLAAAMLAGGVGRLDLPHLTDWLVFRQGSVEGGFQGRTNKLVDGCYSYWQGATFLLLQRLKPQLEDQEANFISTQPLDPSTQPPANSPQGSRVSQDTPQSQAKTSTPRAWGEGDEPAGGEATMRTASDAFSAPPLGGTRPAGVLVQEVDDEGELGDEGGGEVRSEDLGEALLNPTALQGYILLCCQLPEGGLRDKPGKGRDYYHTCYCLSGLSAAQRCRLPALDQLPPPSHVLGPYFNLLEPAEPLCNIHLPRYKEAVAYFEDKPLL